MLKYNDTVREDPSSPCFHRRWTGFIAQEQAAQDAGYAFSGVIKRPIYGLNYAEFVVLLVKAV